MEPGETKVIFEKAFDEDYNNGSVLVTYQDKLGAESDINSGPFTDTVDTDCADPLPNTSTSDSTDEVCVAPGDIEGGSATFSLTAGDEGLSTTVRFKSLGDGTGGTAETFYYLDGTTGAPGEIVDYEVVTLAPGETYTTTVVDLPADDYRFTITGGVSNKERRALQQDVSIAAVDCPAEEEPPTEEPEGSGVLASTGLDANIAAAGVIGMFALIVGIIVVIATAVRRRNALQ